MMKYIAVGLSVLCVAGVAFAALGDVVASWPLSGTIDAVGASNSRIFAFVRERRYVYKLNITTGSVVGSFPGAGWDGTRGLAYVSGGYLWQGDYGSPISFHETDSSTGYIYRSIRMTTPRNYGLAPLCTGDGGVGTTALLSTKYDRPWLLHHVNMTTGSVIASYPTPASVYDPAYDWRNRLVWGTFNSSMVYGFTTTGSLVATFTAPQGVFGAAYNAEYLYLGRWARIWKIHCPQFVGVEPASFGRVKAIFR
jgi:hypothetical protein